MKRIALDMDQVLADVESKYLDMFEKEFGRRPAREEYTGRKFYMIPEAKGFRQRLYEKGFFGDLPVMPGAIEGVKELQKNYEIYIVTAAQEFRNSLEDKWDWLHTHFPSIHWKQFVFCGDKSIINTDYLLDDHAFNLETFQGKGLLYTAPHNVGEDRFQRLNNWAEVVDFFKQELEQ